MSVLVDTSVWVAHFKHRNQTLSALLASDAALTHPMILGELACGTPPEPRAKTLEDIDLLLPCRQATAPETMDLIEREQLYGQGCGWVDMCLLASTLITPGAVVWTRDKCLAGLARQFSIEYRLD